MKIKFDTFNAWLPWLIFASAFFLFYQHTVSTLFYDWKTNPNFSHGFLIPFIAVYMGWCKKEELASIEAKPSRWGILILLAGMGLHVLGTLGAELFILRCSLILTLVGVIVFVYGFAMLKALWIPAAYLFLMIPLPSIIWNKIAFPLQLFAARMSAEVIQLIGIPVFRERNILHLSNTSLEVVDACSGLRSLTSLIALSGIFAFLAPLSAVKKSILFFSAVPVAVVVNVIRLSITAAMAYWISPETAHGFLHDISGLIVFGLALILIYLIFILELKLEKLQIGIEK